MDMPKDKFIATVKVGDKGQIVIPKGSPRPVRHLSRDTLLLLADRQQGIALVSNEAYTAFADAIFEAQKHPDRGED